MLNNIEIITLLCIFCGYELPCKGARSSNNALQNLQMMAFIKPCPVKTDDDPGVELTDLGTAYVKLLKRTPIPVPRTEYFTPDGELIK